MSDRSVDLFKSLQASQEKFDYFILGMSAALFAYIGEKFTPEPLSFSQNTIELLALVFLAISLIAGFKRLELGIDVQHLNFNYIRLNEKCGALTDVALKPGQHFNSETGDMVNQEHAALEAQFIKEKLPELEQEMSRSRNLTGVVYKLRNWALVIGFVLLAFAKVFGAYSA